MVRAFTTLFDRIDTQIAEHIETGIEHNAYLRRVTLPRLVEDSGQLVAPVRDRFTPFSAAALSTMKDLVHERLRPSSAPFAPIPDAARSRAELHSAIVHRPQSRNDALGI